MKIPLVAIIGLPNSGKSTFFNKVLERRTALTYPEAGTTRDRAYGLATWNGLPFYLIDTAGIIKRPNSDLEINIQKQTVIAQAEADLIILLVDGKTNPSTEDLRVAALLSKSGPRRLASSEARKPIVLGVNKIDVRNTKTQTAGEVYQKLGLGQPFMLSSVNGAGIGDILDEVVKKLKDEFENQTIDETGRLKIAFVGRPNVGKSSLINALIQQERLLVHEKAGTTRSTVEVPFESVIPSPSWGGSGRGETINQKNAAPPPNLPPQGGGIKKFLLLDTAGIKKKWDQDKDVEAAAAFQSIRTINQTDVALFVVDASTEIMVQDQIIASQILEQGKACVILLNKIDQLDKEKQERLLDVLPDYLPQMWFVPVLFTSAKTGQGLDLLLKFAQEAFDSSKREIDPIELDQFLEKILIEKMPGKMEDQRAPKIYNLKQIGSNPPTFKMTVNFPAAIATAWKKWFEKQFRLKFGFEGTPIEIKYINKI